MKRSGSRREPSPLAAFVGGAVAASGAAIAENPVLVGSSTAFLVVLFYVSANALWNQPYRHPGPLMETRFVVQRPAPAPAPQPVSQPAPRPAALMQPTSEVTNSVSPGDEQAAAAPMQAAPVQPAPVQERTMRVQIALESLGLYRGTVDGLMGPQTRAAIAGYQKTLGMEATAEIDDRLMEALGIGADRQAARALPAGQPVPLPASPAVASEQAYAAVPVAAPVPRSREAANIGGAADTADLLREARAAAALQSNVVRVQAGLRAFGNEGIEIDGVIGEKTRAAIREFQALFRLPVTGEPDDRLLAKMQEIGLTN
ncbi:peptidoglycan-binding protein [Aquibium carbonis]|uniref:Peptidoglycan-binding protein n=1 Tax=Aquibium carbonis TaxID=2495581 RepID=A0A429YQY5_9HYPH|nr:peptidoglycan-binding domain-containing protein [Aquibium carbonis]RST83840.1 peptidoglycan-binding protein [Aquibium carbonis]